MSDTPRTDNIIEKITKFRTSSAIYSLEQFCRTLEKELTAAREELLKVIEERRQEALKAAAANSGLLMWQNCAEDAERELVKATEQRDRLAVAHKLIAGCLLYDELNEDQIERADFETAYDELIKISREALQSLNPKQE